MREKYIINKKIIQDFEDEIGFEIESDSTIVLYNKKNGVIIGNLCNKFEGYLELDINPEYDIQPLQIEIFLKKFLETEDDEIWNDCKKYISDFNIVQESQSEWKDRIGYVYLN